MKRSLPETGADDRGKAAKESGEHREARHRILGEDAGNNGSCSTGNSCRPAAAGGSFGGKVDSGGQKAGSIIPSVPWHEQISMLLQICSRQKPDLPEPLLRRTASLSDDIEGAARSLLPPDIPPLYPRVWLSGKKEAPPGKVLLKFMQFNVLADGLSGEDPNKGGFKAAPPEALDWQFRRINLVREIFHQGVWPDVISMQEVDHYYDWFEPLLRQLGYDGTYVAKPNSMCKKLAPHSGLEDGCALFWRADTVTVDKQKIETINYDAYNADGTRTGGKSNHVAILAVLQVEGAEPVTAATTHLMAAKTPEGEHVRAQQMGELIRHLERHQHACIVGLDMNAAPPLSYEEGRPSNELTYAAEAYPLAISKTLISGSRHKKLRSAYAEVMGTEPRWTTWKKRPGNCKNGEVSHTIDYVLISDEIECTRILMPPADEEIVPERLPGWSYPSDHVALFAELVLPPAAPVTTIRASFSSKS